MITTPEQEQQTAVVEERLNGLKPIDYSEPQTREALINAALAIQNITDPAEVTKQTRFLQQAINKASLDNNALYLKLNGINTGDPNMAVQLDLGKYPNPDKVDLAQGQKPFEDLKPGHFYTYLSLFDIDAAVELNKQETNLYHVRGLWHQSDVQKLETKVITTKETYEKRKKILDPRLAEIKHQFAKAIVNTGPPPAFIK